MSESRLEIDNQEYQTYLSELGNRWFQGPRVPGSGFGPYTYLPGAADAEGPVKGLVWDGMAAVQTHVSNNLGTSDLSCFPSVFIMIMFNKKSPLGLIKKI